MLKSVNRADLSDQQLVQYLTRQLTQKTVPGSQEKEAPRRPCYMEFPFRIQAPPVVPQGGEIASQAIETPDEFGSWQDLLDWCVSLSEADAAFVVDSHGFVVASAGGESEYESLEGIGAELCYAMEQLERINPGDDRLRSVGLTFGDGAIYSLRAQANEVEEEFVIGVLSSESLKREVQQEIYRQIAKNLPNFL